MTATAAAAVGALVGIGVWLAYSALRGVRVLPPVGRLVPEAVAPDRALRWVAIAAGAALGVGLVTGWPVAAVAVGLGVLWTPAVLGAPRQRESEIATAEAVATWTDMLRDTMAGASGLEEALIQTAAVAPAPIAPQVHAFAARLRHQPLDQALGRLAEDIDHGSVDLLVAALAAAGRLEARDLGGLLGRLAEAIRADTQMRVRVEMGRTRIRTSAKIAVAATAATIAFLYLFAGQLLAAYDTAAGQAWLVVVAGVFAGAGVLLRHYSRLDTPERFTLRRTDEEVAQ
jgi:hypothetical protein